MPENRTRIAWYHQLEDSILVLLTFSLVLLSVSQIILRNIFEITLLWADPLIRHLVLWSGLLGAAVATRRQRHLRIDDGLKILPPLLRPWAEGFGSSFACVLCAGLSWISIYFIHDEMMFSGNSDIGVPVWILQVIFPITFLLISFRFGALALKTFKTQLTDSKQ